MEDIEFVLPIGYKDASDVIHSRGKMRLSTVGDELSILDESASIKSQYHLGLSLLARVITQLGTLREVEPAILESMYAKDLDYLQNLYIQINSCKE